MPSFTLELYVCAHRQHERIEKIYVNDRFSAGAANVTDWPFCYRILCHLFQFTHRTTHCPPLLFIWWQSKHNKCINAWHNPVLTISTVEIDIQNWIWKLEWSQRIYKITQSHWPSFRFFPTRHVYESLNRACPSCFIYPYQFSVIKITKSLHFIYCIVHATCRRTNRFTNYSIGYSSRYGWLCTHCRSIHVTSAILLNFVVKSNNYKQKNYERQVNGPFT